MVDVYLTDIEIKRSEHNICFGPTVEVDNDIGFTIIQIAAHIEVIIEGSRKIQRRDVERAQRLLTE